MKTRVGLLTSVLLMAHGPSAWALVDAPCEADPVARPKWLSFEAGAGVVSGAEDHRLHWVLQADAAYTLGANLLRVVPRSGPDQAACAVLIDEVRDFARFGLGYSVGNGGFRAVSADLSWLRILSPDFSVNLGPAADYRFFASSQYSLPVGLLLRVNYAEWVSLRGRILYTTAHSQDTQPGVSAFVTLSIEPRLYCEHVSRDKCTPYWFFEKLALP